MRLDGGEVPAGKSKEWCLAPRVHERRNTLEGWERMRVELNPIQEITNFILPFHPQEGPNSLFITVKTDGILSITF